MPFASNVPCHHLFRFLKEMKASLHIKTMLKRINQSKGLIHKMHMHGMFTPCAI